MHRQTRWPFLTAGTMAVIALLSIASASAAAGGTDLTHLPLGDGHLSSSPQRAYIWPCHIESNAGGAYRDGPWIHTDGTYDLTAKAVVSGSVNWPHKFTMSRDGERRVFTSNDFPDHATGRFPIDSGDTAYQYDRNPNSIAEQSMRVELPANPQLAASPSCAPGAVGILLTGSVLFSALDAPGRDAVAHETQDKCQGHPQQSGVYHYHSVSTCLPDETTSDGHSKLVGYAIDGFGIFGRRDVGGKQLASANLDECHGHTHAIDWDGKRVVMYHYHATWDFPYTVGCMRGAYNRQDVRTISGPPPSQQGMGTLSHDSNGRDFNGRNTNSGEGSGEEGRGGPMAGPRGGPPGGGPGGHPPRPDLAAAAIKLRISESRLREALGPPPPDLPAAAQRLGISVDELKQALGVP